MPEPKFHQKIAWFNFICCLMVIWTHSGNADLFFPELGQDAPWWHFQYPVMQEILRVDIPCFIMLSAYLFYRNFTMKRLGEKLNKRLHSLLVPYLLWNTIYYVAYVGGKPDSGTADDRQPDGLVITTSGAWQAITKYTFNPVFWFMYQIILLVLLAPVLYLISEKYLDRRGISGCAACGTFQGGGCAGAESGRLDLLFLCRLCGAAREKMGGGGMVVEAGGTGGVPAGSGNRAQQELLYPLFCAGNCSLPASGSHRYLDDGKRALAGRSQTVYDLHLFYLCDALCGGPFPQ